MIRVVLAAIVCCSTLYAAFAQAAPGTPPVGDSAASKSALRAAGCPPADDDGEWRPQQAAALAITESGWKSRAFHAGAAAIRRPLAIVVSTIADRAPAQTTRAPSYLLHTPLLI